VGSAEQRFLTFEQLHTLADAAGAHRPLGYVLGTCGLRFGKVAELRWRDLDLQKKQIRIARSVTLVDEVFKIGSPKNGKGCTVSLPAFVAELLRVQGVDEHRTSPRYPGSPMRWCSPTPRVGICGVATFGGRGGPRPSRREQTTVSDFKVHELRHTALLAIQADADIKALQNVLGHESAGLTLDRYGHLYGSDVEAVGKCGHGQYYNCG